MRTEKAASQLSSKRETFKDVHTNMHSNYSTTKKKLGLRDSCHFSTLPYSYLMGVFFVFINQIPIHFDLEKQRPQTLKFESACSGLRKTVFGVYSFRLFL